MADYTFYAKGSSSSCPYIQVDITITDEDDGYTYYSWAAYYRTSGYPARTNGVARDLTLKIGGDTFTEEININGITATSTTIGSGNSWLTKYQKTRTVECKVEFYLDITWSGTYNGTIEGEYSFDISPKESYSVIYDENGGTGAPSATIKWFGEDLILSSESPTKQGYNFIEWNTKKDGTGTSYNTEAIYNNNAALTLYAQWEPAASIVTLYLPNESGIIEKRRGMMHMYNSSGELCYAIMTVYDEIGNPHLAV